MPEDVQEIRNQSHLQGQIDLIAKHEQEFLAQRTGSEKLGDRMSSFIGSLAFVAVHIVVFTAWLIWNTIPARAVPHFDPYPFPILDVIFAFEAILVASFILMRQSRMSRRAEERDQLMLQILLLTEREITAVLGMQREMAQSMGLHKIASDSEVAKLSQQTSIDEVAHIIKETLPGE
ncbi:MAG TPA: DUF1003 domain-containing protein [Acidobacteriaceae bacterium]|jgi:uncharacterized membrane protein|nr:DUF1003 domain-containing protein [Acidobacteriaceae bacterium]